MLQSNLLFYVDCIMDIKNDVLIQINVFKIIHLFRYPKIFLLSNNVEERLKVL